MEVVTQEPIAATLKEISRAHASQDTWEMDSHAEVGYNNAYRLNCGGCYCVHGRYSTEQEIRCFFSKYVQSQGF